MRAIILELNLIVLLAIPLACIEGSGSIPMVINTWGGAFTVATESAWGVISTSSLPSAAIDAVVQVIHSMHKTWTM